MNNELLVLAWLQCFHFYVCFPKIWLKPNISEDIDSFEGLNYGFLWIASAAFLGGVTQAIQSQESPREKYFDFLGGSTKVLP